MCATINGASAMSLGEKRRCEALCAKYRYWYSSMFIHCLACFCSVLPALIIYSNSVSFAESLAKSSTLKRRTNKHHIHVVNLSFKWTRTKQPEQTAPQSPAFNNLLLQLSCKLMGHRQHKTRRTKIYRHGFHMASSVYLHWTSVSCSHTFSCRHTHTRHEHLLTIDEIKFNFFVVYVQLYF